ncbi:ATP-binding protein [Ancylobacter lacus]|uniref:ATP-binding protein n=1 Tax=Ancylobacter lacus TaxID=2579970 RepID=UPI001FEA6CAC|nr:ATP-binding protein [Ancylobacter lacus]
MDTTNKKNLLLLIQLRWLAVGGQVVTIWFVDQILAIALPILQLSVVILFLVGLNLISLLRHLRQDHVTNAELFIELLLDVAALTVQLYLTGGAANPFISLYLLQVILGTVLLDVWSVWILVAITSGCFVWLTVAHRSIAMPHAHGADLFNLHIQGMFICFVLAACLLAVFVMRIQRNLQMRDAHLADLRQWSAEEDHIVRMGLLASGAAHELGTPLATLSVILSDWERLPLVQREGDLAQEVADMQGQVERCKVIVSGILMSSGEARGEGTQYTSVKGFMDGLVAEWRTNRAPQALDYENAFDPDVEIVSDAALKQILFNVFDNALEASPRWIGAQVRREGGNLVIAVRDAGPGFAAGILEELGKPYRSTKARPGSGLGLFLVVNVVRKLGGTVHAENSEAGGATVALSLPIASLSTGERDVG